MQPYKPNLGQKIKSDAGAEDRKFLAYCSIAAVDAIAPGPANVAPATALADALTTTLTTVDITQPPAPRVLSITGNAATAVGDVVVTGLDANGDALVETIVSTGAATVVGTRAFASITTIVLPARGAGGDTISVGLAGAFGIPFKLANDTIIKILNNNTVTTVAAGSSFHATTLARNYIVPTAALAAAQVDVYLIV